MEKGYAKKESGVTTQGRKEEEVGTFLLGNDKNNVTFNFLFITLVFVLKLLGLNGNLNDYLKSGINKLLRKININFLFEDADSLKISVFFLSVFLDTTYLQKPIAQ